MRAKKNSKKESCVLIDTFWLKILYSAVQNPLVGMIQPDQRSVC